MDNNELIHTKPIEQYLKVLKKVQLLLHEI